MFTHRHGPGKGTELSRAEGTVAIAGSMEVPFALERAQARNDEDTAWEDQRVNELITEVPGLDLIQAIRQARFERVNALVEEIEKNYAEQPVGGTNL